MPRARRPLCLWVLLLLPPLAGAPEPHDPAGPGEAAEEPGSGGAWSAFQDPRAWVSAAGALSRRFWARFSCFVWPETCSLNKEAPAGLPGKTRGEMGH